MPQRREPKVAPEATRASGSGSQRGATVFSSFSGLGRGASADGVQAHRASFQPTSVASFSPGRLFRQAHTGVPEGFVQGTGVDSEVGSDDSLMEHEGMAAGEAISAAKDLGIEDSAECVPSTIPETRSLGLLAT
ncbi:hypothetical protein Salat_0211800 [Sesamum alatum]|uniref:Uncharacterized protein n=1 Tax=Sesamum alatum TaxID=300844 RepID=A0AAE1YZ54_9LAMI|nr:hypothetical protein Salat_0211800 [Sesamum alatum]